MESSSENQPVGFDRPPAPAAARNPPAEGSSRRRSSRHRVPYDSVALAVFYFLLLPLWMALVWPRYWRAYAPPSAWVLLLWLGFGFGVAGTVLLIVSRKPLYFKRHFQSWKAHHLTGIYWQMFFISRVLVIGSALLLLLLVILMQANSGS